MATHCEICKQPTKDRKMRYCRRHAKMKLIEMESAGYLEPLKYSTQDGIQRVSPRRFLSVKSGK